MSFALGGSLPQPVTLLLMALAGMAGGALWAAIPAVLRLTTGANEAITSLLLNYVAGLVLTWLVFERWKDPASLGQAYSEELDARSRLPIMWGERVHAGILIAVVAALIVWWRAALDHLGLPARRARRQPRSRPPCRLPGRATSPWWPCSSAVRSPGSPAWSS